MPVGVHTSGDQGMHPDHPPTLADLEHEGVGGEEGVGPGIERPGPERLHRGIEVGSHPRDLRLAQARDAEGIHQHVQPPGRGPSG